jgi:hypothetical protein
MGSLRCDRDDAHGMQQRPRREVHLPPSLKVQKAPIWQGARRRTPRVLPLLRHQDRRTQRQHVEKLLAALEDKRLEVSLHAAAKP